VGRGLSRETGIGEKESLQLKRIICVPFGQGRGSGRRRVGEFQQVGRESTEVKSDKLEVVGAHAPFLRGGPGTQKGSDSPKILSDQEEKGGSCPSGFIGKKWAGKIVAKFGHA